MIDFLKAVRDGKLWQTFHRCGALLREAEQRRFIYREGQQVYLTFKGQEMLRDVA
jgi:hypothetical protein